MLHPAPSIGTSACLAVHEELARAMAGTRAGALVGRREGAKKTIRRVTLYVFPQQLGSRALPIPGARRLELGARKLPCKRSSVGGALGVA